MKRFVFWLAVTVGLLGGSAVRADYVLFNYDSADVSVVTITGATPGNLATVAFNNAGFGITGIITGSPGNSLQSGAAYTGSLNGSFTVDPTQIQSSTMFGITTELDQAIGGTGTLTISGNGATLTATVTFSEIYTTSTAGSSTSTLDSGGMVTLSGFSESGTDGGYLDELYASLQLQGGTMSTTFSFTAPAPTPDLTTMTGYTTESGSDGDALVPNVNSTNFHGQIVSADPVAPVPASWLMLLSGTGLLGGIRAYRRRSALCLA